MQRALDYLEANKDRFLEQLFEFLRIPSISAQTDCHPEARRAGEFIAQRLADSGFETGLFEGNGLPTVFSSRFEDGDDRETLLLYGHYDVQPPEPLELWETPPFEPTIVDGEVRARGCADDKGPTLAMALAAECWVKGAGSLPVNLRAVIEGEEECGGTVINEYLEANQNDLSASALIIADVSGVSRGVPALWLRPARHGGRRSLCRRPRPRSSLRVIRRHGREPRHRDRAVGRHATRRERARCHRWFLRRRHGDR